MDTTIIGHEIIRDTVSIAVRDTIWVLNPESKEILNCEISIGDILTIVGFVLSLLTVIWQFREARKDYRNNQRDSWMLNVVIQPNLEEMTNLYNETITLINKEIVQLRTKKTVQEPTRRNEMAKLKRKVKNRNKEFFDHFLTLLYATDKQTAKQVSLRSGELDDICTSLIDDYENYKDEASVRNSILKNKQAILGVLYGSMKSDANEKTQDS